ncbi:MAG TPA: adenylate/guanylate cyclase domain-containing protein [Roseiarcus sp.]
MAETRKIAAILVADIVGYSRLAGADEEGTLARLRALRSNLMDPAVAAHHGRIVKRTGDGSLIEFRSVVDAVRCAIEVQTGMVERNAGVPEDRRIEFRIGIHLGDVVEESDGDLMGDGVNIAARLEGIAKPNAICLSEDAYRQVKGRLDLVVRDLGPTQLKNIAEPIRVYSLQVGFAPQAKPAPAPTAEKPGPPRLSLVVLPFANIGGDASQDYFVDGVTESLTTDLSRIGGAFVIGRSTAFAYKGKTVDLKQIGRELNVRYVLEGSVQRAGNRLRVNVQLIEAENGAHLWAERFDKPLADLFEMQDEIVSRLANQLRAELTEAEARRAEQAPNPDSMDLYFQGQAWLNRGWTPDMLTRARSFYIHALDLDPGNIDALVGVAAVDLTVCASFMTDDHQTLLAEAETRLARALAVAPNNALAHLLMGVALRMTNWAQRSVEEMERGLAIDPNLATARALIGSALSWMGRAQEAEAHVLEALRLSPRDAMTFEWFLIAGLAKAYLGEFVEAVTWLRKSIDANRNRPLAFFLLAACFAHLGRLDEASREIKAGLAVDPKFTLQRYRKGLRGDNPVYLAQRERVIEGMRKAGVPEG